MKKEIEIKIKLNNKERQKIKQKLGKFTIPMKETTYGFFTKDGKSIEKGIFPRIKEYNDSGMGLLTIKIKKEDNKDYFQRDEHEKEIKNVEWFRNFLKILGYEKEIIFEKKREKKRIKNGILICLDTLPFGEFIEIEGEKKLIEKIIKELGLEKRERITKAYLMVWADYKKAHGITEENCVFK